MKKFSQRINADWHSAEALENLLNEFFEDYTEPKTLTHLYCWLNTDWITLLKRREINPDYRRLIDAATNECEKWVVNHGFENDKSFAKFTLQTQHQRTVETKQEIVQEQSGEVVVKLVEDKG